MNGLYYKENIELPSILEELDRREWKKITTSENSRKIQHYGFTYDYAARKSSNICEPFPECIAALAQQLKDTCVELGIVAEGHEFNQCIVNDYQPGQGISKHIDIKQYGPVIGCFTIGSGAMMTFRIPDTNAQVNCYVKENSLYIMSGDARYKWTHEMASRKSDVVDGQKVARGRRVSITFRSLQV